MKEKILWFYYKILAKLAKFYLKKNNPYIIWVTWSIWKTSSRMIISKLLWDYLEEKKLYTSPKNYNWELGFALSVLQIENYKPSVLGLLFLLCKSTFIACFGKTQYDILFLEYWIDHPGEMDVLLDIAKPHIWIFTRVDKVHAQFFWSPDDIAQEKFKMIENSKEAVFLNIDDKYLKTWERRVSVDKFFYTLNSDVSFEEVFDDKVGVSCSNYTFSLDKKKILSKFDFVLNGEKYFEVQTNLVGKENAWYICIGFVLLDVLYYKFLQKSFLKQNISETFDIDFVLQPGRFSVFKWIKNSVIIDSSYNASPHSVQKVLENVWIMKNSIYQDYKIISVLWDMRELGDFAEKEHNKLSNVLSQVSDYVFLVGELMEKYLYPQLSKVGFSQENIWFFSDSFELWNFLKDFLWKNDEKFIIVFKWSQNTIFLEEAVKYVLDNPKDKSGLVRQNPDWLKKKWF